MREGGEGPSFVIFDLLSFFFFAVFRQRWSLPLRKRKTTTTEMCTRGKGAHYKVALYIRKWTLFFFLFRDRFIIVKCTSLISFLLCTKANLRDYCQCLFFSFSSLLISNVERQTA